MKQILTFFNGCDVWRPVSLHLASNFYYLKSNIYFDTKTLFHV